MEVVGESSCSLSMGKSAQERGLPYVSDCYVNQISHRLSSHPKIAHVPVIDLAGLRRGSAQQSIVIQEIGNACHRVSFFQVCF